MADKPIRLRTLAAADLEDAANYYRDHAGEHTAFSFLDEVQAAFGLISSGPGVGSLRYSYDLDIPGLRAFRIKRFDHAVFYVEDDDIVDVWRILHTRRDMPETLEPPERCARFPKRVANAATTGGSSKRRKSVADGSPLGPRVSPNWMSSCWKKSGLVRTVTKRRHPPSGDSSTMASRAGVA